MSGGPAARKPEAILLHEAVFTHALDAMLLADDGGSHVDANPAACALTGYQRGELLRMGVPDLAERPEMLRRSWARFLDRGRAEGTYSVRRRDGSLVETEFRAVANVSPGVHLAVMRDITSRLRAEREADRRAEQIDLILEQLPAVIWTVDRELSYTFGSGFQTTGRPPGAQDPATSGVRLEDQADTPEELERVLAAYHRALRGDEARFEASSAGTVWNCHLRPLRDRSREVVGVLGVGLDVTEMTRMRRELEATVQTLQVFEDQRRELIRELLVAREEERRRLSRELHDDLGQSLTSVKLLAAGLTNAPEDRMRSGLADIQDLVQQAVDSTRDLVGGLRRETPEDPTLQSSLHQLASETESLHGVAVGVSVNVDADRLPLEVTTAVHRIASEATNNAVKHAAAGLISIVAMRYHDDLVLVVEDDGAGFDPSVVAPATEGHGLIGMRERAEELGGALTVAAAPGKGTVIRAEFPLEPPT